MPALLMLPLQSKRPATTPGVQTNGTDTVFRGGFARRSTVSVPCASAGGLAQFFDFEVTELDPEAFAFDAQEAFGVAAIIDFAGDGPVDP